MSTIPAAGVRFPLLKHLDGAQREVQRLSGRISRRVVAELRAVPAYLARYATLVLALLGLLSLWDAHGDGQVPAMVPLMATQKDPHDVSAARCAEQGTSDSDRWQGLAAALAILDDVNPQVASWVRDRREHGALVFSDRYSWERDKHGSLAKYDHLSGKLTLRRALFEEKDGEIAAILCHEYRHSRQNAAKLLKCILSFVLTAEGDRSILENDAELYEHEALAAIFRQPYAGKKDLLAARSTKP